MPRGATLSSHRLKSASSLIGALLAASCAGAGGRDLSSLTSPEAPTRARAVLRLGKAASPEDFPLLLARISDPDPTVRANVALALGRYDTLPSVEALSDLSADAVEAVQLAAVQALGLLTLAQAQAQLLRTYQQGTPMVRAEVARVLRATHRSPQLALEAEAGDLWQRLSLELTRGKLEERIGAAEELGRSGKPQAVERLTEYLGAEPTRLAAAAITGLGASRSPEARRPLEALLTSDYPELQAAAAQALGSLGMPEAAPALAQLAARGGSLGRIALDGIEALGAGEVTDSLCRTALGDDPEVAFRAARLVREARSACDLKPFLTKLGRDRVSVAAGLAALAELPHEASPTEVRRFRALLGPGPREVRALAARAAGALGIESLAPEVTATFEAAGTDLAAARQRWVTVPWPAPDAGDGESELPATPVRDRFFASDPEDLVTLRSEAGAAALRLRVPASLRISQALAADPSVVVRVAAAEGLQYLQPQERMSQLWRLMEDPEPRVRSSAIETLPAALEGATAPQVAMVVEKLLGELRRQDRDPPSAEASLLIDRLGKLGALCPRDPGSTTSAPACEANIQKALAAALRIGETAGVAASAIRWLPGEGAGELLLARLGERPSAGLPELIAAAAEREANAAQPLLHPLLFHTRPGVRAAAARALKDTHSPEVLEDLQALRADYFVAVREAVAPSDPTRKGP